jgi:hypothetical protein
MLTQFTVVDTNEIFMCDTAQMVWARGSGPASDPESKVVESGKLVPQGFGIYALDGRVKPGQTEGLATIGLFVIAIGTTVKIFIRANVAIKDFTMPVPINQVLYEILPNDPAQVAQAIGAIQEANDAANNGGNSNPTPDSGGDRTLPAPESEGQPEGQEGNPTPGTDGEVTGGAEGNAG